MKEHDEGDPSIAVKQAGQETAAEGSVERTEYILSRAGRLITNELKLQVEDVELANNLSLLGLTVYKPLYSTTYSEM